MKKVLLAAALTLALAVSLTGTAAAQTQYQGPTMPTGPAITLPGTGTEVCVNASNVADAQRLFPKATLHVIADFVDPLMNGWRIVTGSVGAGGRVMTDAEEIQLRQRESNTTRSDS